MESKQWNIGDVRNGYPILKNIDRKKILLLCDDIRLYSGVATMAREFVIGTCHYYNWVQIGGAIKHPDGGKIVDISKSVEDDFNIPEVNIQIYPTDGYGNPQMLRDIIQREHPSLILHFTDPRFWKWLYDMEHELRQTIPIAYYNIWDQPPIPQYNKSFYKSCDLIMNINKQTKLFVTELLKSDNKTNITLLDEKNKYPENDLNIDIKKEYLNNTTISYVPHGINEHIFRPLELGDKEYDKFSKFKRDITQGKNFDLIFLFNSRNIRRKQISDIMVAYKFFCDEIGYEQASRTLLLLKTNPIDNNGTDLIAIYQDLMPECNIKILDEALTPNIMNYLYNVSDVCLSISSAEGFGLSSAEALMCGKLMIGNVVGGLQDQMGFKNEDGNIAELDINHIANSDKKYTSCGSWAFPIFPDESIQGSPPTPYIYDSRCRIEDIVEQMINVYNIPKEERIKRGIEARKWMCSKLSNMSSENMCESIIFNLDHTITNFKPKRKYIIEKIEKNKKLPKVGLFNKRLNKWV